MPSASNGPLQATGPRPSPSRDRKVQPVGPSRLARTCAKGVCDGTSRPSTTATATLPAERDREKPWAPSRPTTSEPLRGLPAPRRSGNPGPAPRRRAAALLWSSAGKPLCNLVSPDPGLGPPGRATLPPRGRRISYLVDPASSHMLVSKIKPCMSKYRPKQGETANGSLNQLWFIGSYPFLLG